ncbi:hypothetical protein ROJ8625_04105 [Roseivivax jejudonensis]|uniref:YiaA/B two helix domain protein n=1 Tax=Roseivivax jejudonensis TaxID=1529041 RepID=A0A1X7ADD9_9RHOB|nr:hypothetical protein [Roseivivax jejudonensis]SLN74809.1 hypothetical protein ROJ8625_04105 [Roseivivax jejudonensis]
MAEREVIIVSETPLQSWMRDASTFALFAGLVGLGVWTDSSAMEWAGFLIAILFFLIKASVITSKNVHTISEARKRLDEIEQEATND